MVSPLSTSDVLQFAPTGAICVQSDDDAARELNSTRNERYDPTYWVAGDLVPAVPTTRVCNAYLTIVSCY